MRLCKILGNVCATVKHPAYTGRPLLIVQPLDATGSPEDSSFLAIDTVQAGPGDTVLVLKEGTGVRQILSADATSTPIRSLIVGIVDAVTVAPDEGASF